MNSRAAVVEDPLKVNARLAELGLTEEILVGAVRAGISVATSCTQNHPPNYPGMTVWAEAVKFLRDNLIPLGWIRSDAKNFSTAVRGDGRVAVAVARGDEMTGNSDPDAIPSTKYPRGIATLEAIERNLTLPFDHVPQISDLDTELPVSTWFLLHSRQDEKIVCELSRPTAINSSGYVESWDERILLAPITLDPARMPVLDDEPVNPEIAIRRRDAS